MMVISFNIIKRKIYERGCSMDVGFGIGVYVFVYGS